MNKYLLILPFFISFTISNGMNNGVLANCQERLVNTLKSYNERVQEIQSNTKLADQHKKTKLSQAQLTFEFLTGLDLSEPYNPLKTNPRKYVNSISYEKLEFYLQPGDYK